MAYLYILKGREVVPCEDVLEWAARFESSDRHVAKTIIGEVRISTVFIGINSMQGRRTLPQVFETMIFGGFLDGYQYKYPSWQEAWEGHGEAVECVEESIMLKPEMHGEKETQEVQEEKIQTVRVIRI